MEILGDALGGVGVETGVEVHGDLDGEDDGEDGPFLPGGEAEAQLVVAVRLGQLDLVFGVIGFFVDGIGGGIGGVFCSGLGGVFGDEVLLSTGCLSELAVVGGEVSDVSHDGRARARLR